MSEPEIYLAVMLGTPASAAGWKPALSARLAEWSVFLGHPAEDGFAPVEVTTGRALYGSARVVARDEAQASLARFLEFRSSCPHLQDLEVLGVVEIVEDYGHHRGDVLVALIEASAGLVVAPDRDVARPTVVERSYPLADLLVKYGFDDGDRLLPWDFDVPNDYILDCIARIERAAAAAGLELLVGLASTCHNPFRVQELRSEGRQVERDRMMRKLLEPIRVSLWTHDFDLGKDETLFP